MVYSNETSVAFSKERYVSLGEPSNANRSLAPPQSTASCNAVQFARAGLAAHATRGRTQRAKWPLASSSYLGARTVPQHERQEEYAEFASRCQEFLQEIERETEAHKWTFAELEENEHDLHKLTQWLHQIQRRDFFPNASAQEAVTQLARCTETLQNFAQVVYAQHGVISSEEASSGEEASFLPAYHEQQEEMGRKA